MERHPAGRLFGDAPNGSRIVESLRAGNMPRRAPDPSLGRGKKKPVAAIVPQLVEEKGNPRCAVMDGAGRRGTEGLAERFTASFTVTEKRRDESFPGCQFSR